MQWFTHDRRRCQPLGWRRGEFARPWISVPGSGVLVYERLGKMPHFFWPQITSPAPLPSHPCRPGWIYCTQPAPDTQNLLRRAQFLSPARLKKKKEKGVCVRVEKERAIQSADDGAYTCGFQLHVTRLMWSKTQTSCLCYHVLCRAGWILSKATGRHMLHF